jgi:hypothetical protein
MKNKFYLALPLLFLFFLENAKSQKPTYKHVFSTNIPSAFALDKVGRSISSLYEYGPTYTLHYKKIIKDSSDVWLRAGLSFHARNRGSQNFLYRFTKENPDSLTYNSYETTFNFVAFVPKIGVEKRVLFSNSKLIGAVGVDLGYQLFVFNPKLHSEFYTRKTTSEEFITKTEKDEKQPLEYKGLIELTPSAMLNYPFTNKFQMGIEIQAVYWIARPKEFSPSRSFSKMNFSLNYVYSF